MFNWFRRLFGSGRAAPAGDRGERLAAVWLERERGFTIVVRNWRSPRDRRDELDLVCRDGEALVFVEVKTRSAEALVPGYHAVDERKKTVLRRAATAYLARLREKPHTIRFDIVEVETPSFAQAPEGTPITGEPGEPVVRHFENIPLFPKNFRA
jgi:putative endonuclease